MKKRILLGWLASLLLAGPVFGQSEDQKKDHYWLGMYYSQSRLDPRTQKMPGQGIGIIVNSQRKGIEAEVYASLFDDEQKLVAAKIGWRQELPKPIPNNFWLIGSVGYGVHFVPLYPSHSGAIGEIALRKDFETWGRTIFALGLGVSYFYGRNEHFPTAVARLEIRGLPLFRSL